MKPDPGPVVGSEPADVTELRQRTDDVRTLLREASNGGEDLRQLVGLQALAEHLTWIQPQAERSAWIMQPRYFYDPEDSGVPHTRAATARGVQTLLVVPPAVVATHPLLSSIFPLTRLAPVFLRAMVVDERLLTVEGPDSADGERTSWFTTRPELVGAVLELWQRTIALSRPLLEPGRQPPLSPRQLEVARLLCVGEKDSAVARRLGMSQRTVERDVRAILRHLDAGSRAEGVLVMRGRGVNSGGY